MFIMVSIINLYLWNDNISYITEISIIFFLMVDKENLKFVSNLTSYLLIYVYPQPS